MFFPRWIAWIGVTVIAPVVLTSAVAQAAPRAAQASRQRASAVFTEGEAAFAEGNYGVALQKFEAAQALAFSPVVNFNIAVCLERLGRAPQAAQKFQLVADDPQVPVDVRERARVALANLRPPPNPAPPRSAAPVAPPALAAPAPAPEHMGLHPSVAVPSTPQEPRWLGPVGWAGTAAAGLGVAGAGVAWVLGASNRDEYNDPSVTDLGRLNTLADRGDRYDLALKLCVGLAITGGLAALVDWAWLSPRHASVETAPK